MHLIYGIENRERFLFSTAFEKFSEEIPPTGYFSLMIDSYRYWADLVPNALLICKKPIQTICVASKSPLDAYFY